MADHYTGEIEKFKKILQERYQKIISELEGSEALMPPEGWGGTREEYKETHRFINSLNLRLASDDFVTVLKELKKLK